MPKITKYPAGTTLGDTDILVAVQGGATKKITGAQIKAGASAHVTFGNFISHPGNPILSPVGTEGLTAFFSVVKVASTYHGYYHYNLPSGASAVGHATSSDGKTWIRDTANNPVLSPETTGWDRSGVGVPQVWKEGATFYMIFRGRPGSVAGASDATGLATSTDGITWTKSASNPVLYPSPGEWDALGAESWGVIKVGSTYYDFYEAGSGLTRSIGIATSTDLVNWTKDVNNPILTGGRFCPFAFKYGDLYYLIVPYYTESSLTFAELEIYSCATPTFYPADRTYMGVVRKNTATAWDSNNIDTPFVLTDDINRNSFAITGDEIWMYFSSYSISTPGAWAEGLLIARKNEAFQAQENSTQEGTGLGLFNKVVVNTDLETGTLTASGSASVAGSGIIAGDLSANVATLAAVTSKQVSTERIGIIPSNAQVAGKAKLSQGTATVTTTRLSAGSLILLTPQDNVSQDRKSTKLNAWGFRKRGSGRREILRERIADPPQDDVIWKNYFLSNAVESVYDANVKIASRDIANGSFVISSSDANDNRYIGWMLIELT